MGVGPGLARPALHAAEAVHVDDTVHDRGLTLAAGLLRGREQLERTAQICWAWRRVIGVRRVPLMAGSNHTRATVDQGRS